MIKNIENLEEKNRYLGQNKRVFKEGASVYITPFLTHNAQNSYNV